MAVTDNADKARRTSQGLGTFVWMVLLVLLFGWLLSRFMRSDVDPGITHPAVGRTLLELELQGLGTSTSVERNDLKGSVVLINFWGTWCPPCRAELPHIAELGAAFADRDDFRLLTVSCGQNTEEIYRLETTTFDYLRSKRIEMPVYADIGGTTRRSVAMALDGQFQFGGYPTTILLDRDTVIQAVWQGYVPGTEKEMRRQIERLLAAEPAAE